MGKMKLSEKIMSFAFILTLVLWMLTSITGMDATFIALMAIDILLVTGVLSVQDVLKERSKHCRNMGSCTGKEVVGVKEHDS